MSPIRRIAVGARADEDQPGGLDGVGEVGVLGKKAVAGMDRIRAGCLRAAAASPKVEIGFRRLRRPDVDALVGQPHGKQILSASLIDLTVAIPKLARRANDAHGDLAAIGDQEFCVMGDLNASDVDLGDRLTGHHRLLVVDQEADDLAGCVPPSLR